MRTIDDEKEREKEREREKEKEKVREVHKERRPLRSLANGIKSLRISVPRFPLTIYLTFPTLF